jgi:hypothetical protein
MMRSSAIFSNSPTMLRGRVALVLLPMIFWEL